MTSPSRLTEEQRAFLFAWDAATADAKAGRVYPNFYRGGVQRGTLLDKYFCAVVKAFGVAGARLSSPYVIAHGGSL